MDKEIEKTDIYRGIGRCLSDGVSVLTDSFWRMILLVLPAVLPLAVLGTATLFVVSDVRCFANSVIGLDVFQIIMGVLIVLNSAVVLAVVYRLIDLRLQGMAMKRIRMHNIYNSQLVVKSAEYLVAQLVFAVVVGVFMAGAWFAYNMEITESDIELQVFQVSAYVILALLLIAVASPLLLCYPSVQFVKGNVFKRLWFGYRHGWRRWGKVFSLGLLSYMIVYIIGMLFAIAMVMIYMERVVATNSMMNGEGDSLTFWEHIVAVMVFLFVFFVTSVLEMIPHTAATYMYLNCKKDVYEETTID